MKKSGFLAFATSAVLLTLSGCSRPGSFLAGHYIGRTDYPPATDTDLQLWAPKFAKAYPSPRKFTLDIQSDGHFTMNLRQSYYGTWKYDPPSIFFTVSRMTVMSLDSRPDKDSAKLNEKEMWFEVENGNREISCEDLSGSANGGNLIFDKINDN